MYRTFLVSIVAAILAPGVSAAGFQSSDVLKLRSAGSVEFSPDGTRIAYTVTRGDGPRRPYDQLWIMTLADGKSISLSSGDEPSSGPGWSPDGKRITYSGRVGNRSGLVLARADGTDKRFLAE